MTNKTRSGRYADHLEAIADSTTDALVAIDARGKVMAWNRAAEAVFGFAADEMVGQSLNAVIPERFREAHDQGLKRVNSGGDQHVIGHSVRLAGCRRDGSEFPIELTLSTWKSNRRRYYGGIIRDVSEQARTEEELRTSEARMRAILETAHDAIIMADSRGIVRT